MAEPLSRRLPGVRFEVPPPVLDEALPRMDIAFFVGFAGRGPLERAVVVESLAEFEAVYGSGIALARDARTGAMVTGLLHPCVRSFFSQGGRRCWILRVAGETVHTRSFALPGVLLAQRGEAHGPWRLAPARLQAGTPGSGADTLRLAARTEPVVLRALPLPDEGQGLVLQVPLTAAAAVLAGDLLRSDADGGAALFLRVLSRALERSSCRLTVECVGALRPLVSAGTVTAVVLPQEDDAPTSPPVPVRAQLQDDGVLRLHGGCSGPLPEPGMVLELLGDEQPHGAWLVLAQADVLPAYTPGAAAQLQLAGRAWQPQEAGPLLAAWRARGEERVLQRLRLQLQVRDGEAAPVLSPVLRLDLRAPAGAAALSDPLRFALVAPAPQGDAVWLPLGALAGFAPEVAPLPTSLPPLERDGLAEFSWTLFADPVLAGHASDVLAERAEALRYAGHPPRVLRGLHALFGGTAGALVDEPSLLAVPDAVHAGWEPAPFEPAWVEEAALPEPTPAARDTFAACAAEPLPRPAFVRGADPDPAGAFTLYWTEVAQDARYVLEEASDAGFASATPLYQGGERRFTVAGRPPGTFRYRVRATAGPAESGWSRPVRIAVRVPGHVTREHDGAQLLSIHRLMLRCAAARGDVLAVLSLPAWFDRRQAIAHAQALRDTRPHGNPDQPPALGDDEGRALSHGALYHPWLVIQRDATSLRFPPDGAACGQLAGSALARGAWLAVANQPLRDVVALVPPALAPEAPHRQALLEAQVNLVRNAPHGFVLSTADTLSPDPSWRPVNVRRLMSLLRRLALRRGTTYVFEPNGPALRRTVERSFGAMLDALFRRGAFAGARAEAAYRVEAGDEVNTPQRRDAGQFWVQLKVAPALPMSFLTVRLVREGDRVASRELH